MERIVYILGTCHAYQRNDDSCLPNSIDEFKLYLKSVCQLNGIKSIGEEMSLTALEENDRKESIPKTFAQEYGNLPHRYCDPDRSEQERLGIKPSDYFNVQAHLEKWPEEKKAKLEWEEDLKREPSWLCNILELNVWPLLFICGSKHVESFSQLLSASSFIVYIVNKNWKCKNT